MAWDLIQHRDELDCTLFLNKTKKQQLRLGISVVVVNVHFSDRMLAYISLKYYEQKLSISVRDWAQQIAQLLLFLLLLLFVLALYLALVQLRLLVSKYTLN
jgi:hypothetical protein